MAGSTTCQVSRFFQLWETMLTMFRMSSGSLSQSPAGPWRSLLIRTGARPLARKSRAKLVASTGSLSTKLPSPGTIELVLVVHELFGAQAIPVVLTEEADARQPAGAFQAVEVVELPLLAGAEVLADLKVAGQPVDAALKVSVDAARAAVLDRFALQELAALKSPEPRDDQARDPRTGHACGRDIGIGSVGPASVAFLAALPVARAKAPRRSGFTGTPTSLAACSPSRAYWVFELSPGRPRFDSDSSTSRASTGGRRA